MKKKQEAFQMVTKQTELLFNFRINLWYFLGIVGMSW